jgi:hypothetical protein
MQNMQSEGTQEDSIHNAPRTKEQNNSDTQLGIMKASNSKSRARLASSIVSFNLPTFRWTPTRLMQFLMNAQITQLLDDPEAD